MRERCSPSLSCQTCIVIHMTNTFPSYYIISYNFSASSQPKNLFCDTTGISLKCATFHSAYLIQYVVICIKMNAWMGSQLDAIESIGWVPSVDHAYCVLCLCVCHLLYIYVCWHVSEQMGVICLCGSIYLAVSAYASWRAWCMYVTHGI